ncbi:MAG: DUF599 domain-containing protein [Gammaproteobacteria bacterium]|nr:DUF599 domain-containing protein [Gammaproteobacteria bacterium]
MWTDLGFLELASAAWFVGCWVGYSYFSRYRSKHRRRLQDALHLHIQQWIEVLYVRELRIVDTSVIGNLERNATFFASSSLLIIAGLMTAIGSTDQAITFLSELPFVQNLTRETWELGIFALILVYAYAFFTFTWCMRQWGFASIMVGSAAPIGSETGLKRDQARHSRALARIVWLAVYHFNLGLRAFYFSLALLAWFVHPLAFIVATFWVVAVLYRREFHSRTLVALMMGIE